MSSYSSTAQAFDSIAKTYDATFTYSVIGRAQRNVVWRELHELVRPGDRVLDMNCGTGEDALYLAGLGAEVLACDCSTEMLNVAREKAIKAGRRVSFAYQNIEEIDSLPQRTFDVVLSNFSGLNCIGDLPGVAMRLAGIVKDRGAAVLCVSTRICVWETVYYLTRRDTYRAFRRWAGFAEPRISNNAVPVWYPTVAQIRRAMRPHFNLESIQAVGLSVPPSYLEGWARRSPKAIQRLEQLDRLLSQVPLLRTLGDHVLLRFRRSDA